MTRTHRHRLSRRLKTLRLVAVLLFVLAFVPWGNLRAATLSSASLAISDPRPGTGNVSYTFTASGVTTAGAGLIRCIKLIFADTPSGSTVPSGMITNGGGVAFDTASSNYVPTPASWTLAKPANGTLTLTNATGESPATATARKIAINGITNSSTADTRFFLRFSTYANTDCATSPVDATTTSFIFTNGSTMSLTVDDALSFSVGAVASGQACDGTTTTAASTATTIPFGTVTSAANAVVCQDLTAATNAAAGYTIYARSVGQPTNSLAQTIASHAGSNAAPTAFPAAGTEAYGYTTNDTTLGTGTANRFTSPTQNWAAMTTSNSELAYEPAGVTATTYRIGHQVGVSLTTRPGTYTTTIIYTCTPTY